MEGLNQLESKIDLLLSALENLKQENAGLRSQLEQSGAEKAALEEKNDSLQQALQNEERVRASLVQRIDHLLQKICEHDNIG